jgi:hypothetical protein
MRAILVSGGVLAIAGIFGLGIVFGRFILDRDAPVASAPSNTIIGPRDIGEYLPDSDGVITDSSRNAAPPASAAPLPPAIPPSAWTAHSVPPPQLAINSAKTEADAVAALSNSAPSCTVRVSASATVRSWKQKDQVSATAIGPTCGTSVVRIMLETPKGSALYSLQAPAKDFGIALNASAADVRNRLTAILPTNAVRAAAYPAWIAGGSPPTRTEFSREAYEAIRAANNPVICLKMPTAAQRCVAAEIGSGQVKVFSRG